MRESRNSHDRVDVDGILLVLAAALLHSIHNQVWGWLTIEFYVDRNRKNFHPIIIFRYWTWNDQNLIKIKFEPNVKIMIYPSKIYRLDYFKRVSISSVVSQQRLVKTLTLHQVAICSLRTFLTRRNSTIISIID